ncbi:MAG TPA: hypothetical protein VKR27_05185 [Acidimicrobiales bacterium]|nr:hypothetical protein [Acidimicrobiales bacterium]
MKVTRFRLLFSAVLGLAAIAIPISVTTLTSGGTSTSTNGPDTVQYVQTTGNGGTYVEYLPGNGSTPTTQSVTGSGGCATPTVHGAPILGFSAFLYPNTDYSGAPTPAVVGAYKQRTGVCAIPQDWSIENEEALDFFVGSNALVNGRIFARAQIELQRQDKSSSPSITVDLVESQGGTPVASQTCTITGGAGTQLLADTNTSPSCVGTSALLVGFDTVEIREMTVGGSVSVVGPTSIFTMAGEICPGQSITTTSDDGTSTADEVTATVSLVSTPGGQCKSYTDFAASADDPEMNGNFPETTKSVTFESQQLAGAVDTFTIDWGTQNFCRPDGAGAPTCQPTLVSVPTVMDGEFLPQSYCAVASNTYPPGPVCTTSRTFTYLANTGGADCSDPTCTDITETWSGLNDVGFHDS